MLDRLIILTLIGLSVGVTAYVITFKNFLKNVVYGISGAYFGGLFSQLFQSLISYDAPSLLTAWVFSVSVILIDQINILSKSFSLYLKVKTGDTKIKSFRDTSDRVMASQLVKQ